jgi:hypothetical protein
MAVSGWTERSSLPPKPPPTAVGMIRTSLGGNAEDGGDLVAVHVGGLGAGDDLDAVTDAAGVAGLGFDVGMLDEAGACFDIGAGCGGCECGFDVAGGYFAAAQDVAGGVDVQVGGGGGIRKGGLGEEFPGDRQVGVVDGGQGIGVADQGADGLAAMADVGFGEHRLVFAGRVDAVEVAAGDVRRGQDSDQAGMFGQQWREIAQGEAGVGVRAADRSERQDGFRRQGVGAETVGSGQLGGAVDLGEPCSDGLVGGRCFREWLGGGGDVEDGLDDFAIAGAAA